MENKLESKPMKSIEELIKIINSRGIIIGDEDKVKETRQLEEEILALGSEIKNLIENFKNEEE